MSTVVQGGTKLESLSTQYDIITELQKAACLDAEDLAGLPFAGAFAPRRVRGVHGPVGMEPVPVTRRIPARKTLSQTLESRTSERFFNDTKVGPDLVAEVMRAGTAYDQTQWAGECANGLELDLLVAARQVDGMVPGFYRFADETFTPVEPLTEPLDDLVLQLEFASAPFIVLALAPLADELQRWSDHGERVANLRTGGAIAAGLLAGQARGLSGSPFAGFLSAPLRRLLNTDGYENAPMFAAAFGYR
ncbi:nitroreductase family protein [Paeniglutamicibacter gangotriensis]|uniref:SagB-type dehydrogenase domain-containing protein n=1 Tax=Paeniglutamicibacter gangotriensis Lz1y TaxID=1276920 RepID=M7NF18_9MICC|nr:nitroreductase family protein [Paeniglutamicibacter gangotriensis]EMR00415.1 SagB-type dehydrogenase domain-containing protein [Paeniglutamicibacter gangotriensis Lz1y]